MVEFEEVLGNLVGCTGALQSRYLRCQGLKKRDPRIGMEQGLLVPLLRIRNMDDGDAGATAEFPPEAHHPIREGDDDIAGAPLRCNADLSSEAEHLAWFEVRPVR